MGKYFCRAIIIVLFISCTSGHPDSSRCDSDDYETAAQRVEKLGMEIKPSSAFSDAEFELFNVNGFHGQRTAVAGASSWDYKFVVKIDTADIDEWTKGMNEVELTDYDDTWTKQIITHRKQNWNTDSNPRYFKRDGEEVTMVVFKKEGILFKRVTNL